MLNSFRLFLLGACLFFSASVGAVTNSFSYKILESGGELLFQGEGKVDFDREDGAYSVGRMDHMDLKIYGESDAGYHFITFIDLGEESQQSTLVWAYQVDGDKPWAGSHFEISGQAIQSQTSYDSEAGETEDWGWENLVRVRLQTTLTGLVLTDSEGEIYYDVTVIFNCAFDSTAK